MSKKTQKNQPQKKEIEIVDQQKDPMLRALQKKVRNMNKKLNQIAELSTKKDLKPEQEQKVSKRNQVVQEKEKYLEMIEVYKQIAVESEKIIRKTQLAQLEDLAEILAARQYNVDLGFLFNQNVDNYVRVFTTPTSNDLTLRQRIDEISATLIQAANNSKLKKNLKQFVLANPQTRNTTKDTQAEQISQPVNQHKVQKQQVQEKKQAEPVLVQPAEPKVEQTVQTPAPLLTTQPVTEVLKQQTQEKVATNPAQTTTEAPQVTATENTATEGQKGDGKQQKRGYRGYRGNKGPRGEHRDRNADGQQRPYKKTFKPKYDNEQGQAPKREQSSSSSSSLSSEPKARQFKRQQVRELIEDGFIVVGKPKIKPKDPKQYKEFHDHQHGKKHHHHNSKRNF